MLPEIPQGLTEIAVAAGCPVYLVGGCVRNALLGLPDSDLDICGPQEPEALAAKLSPRFACAEINRRLGTVVIADREAGGRKYEYTAFRVEKYAPGGGHTPQEVSFTADIAEDARRRDFRANAVYFDVLSRSLTDPLGGLADIERRVLSAERPERVFASDGLRVLRLARLSAELGFTPERETLRAAADAAVLLADISPERIQGELIRILAADTKYPGVSPENGPAEGLRLLNELGALRVFLPEIADCAGVPQRRDYHKYDVFGHTLETVRHADPSVRLAALFHDVAKPVMLRETGKMAGHDARGEVMTRAALRRLRFPNRTTDETARLVGLHMLDLDGKMRESKVRFVLAKNYGIAERLLLLKQADYLGSGLTRGESPVVVKWRGILEKMRADGTPLTERDLLLTAQEMSVRYQLTGKALGEARRLLWECAVKLPELNGSAEKLARCLERDVLPRMRRG